jgi:hypothetical protein
MTTITGLQEHWQKELTQFQKDDAVITAKSALYLEKVEALQKKMDGYHGLSNLKKAFFRATEMVWFHHKQNMYARRTAKKEHHIEEVATKTLTIFSETVAANSPYAEKFSALDMAHQQAQNAHKIARDAADKCYSAISMEKQAAATAGTEKHWSHDTVASLYAHRAVNGLRETEKQLQDLQHTLHQSGSKIETEVAKATKDAPFSFTFSSDNADLVKQLTTAHDYLQSLVGHLDTAEHALEKEKKALVSKALKEIRSADKETNTFAKTLESYTAVKTLKKASPQPKQ